MLIPGLLICGEFIVGLVIQPWKNQKRAKNYLLISFLVLSLVSGFRAFNVGADTSNYVRAYNGIEWLYGTRYEEAFLLLMRILHSIGISTTGFLIITSMITMMGICRFIYKWSLDPLLSILLYMLLRYYFGTMNTIRQGIAIAISALAISNLLTVRSRKNYIISFGLLILGSLFHSSCLIMLVPWFLWVFVNGKLLKRIEPLKGFLYSVVLALVGFFLFPLIINVLSALLPSFYLGYFHGTWSDSNYSASLWKMLITFVFFLVGTIYINRKEEIDENDKFSILIMGLALFFGVLSMRMEIFGRISTYFSIIIPLYWTPRFTSYIYDSRRRLFVKAIIVIFAITYAVIIAIYRPQWNCVIPFSFH